MPGWPLRLGVHVSIAGGIEKAVRRAQELGCSAMQIFSRNPRGWKTSPLTPRSIEAFREGVRRSAIDPIVVHTPYLLNLASANEDLYGKSISALAQDLKRAEQLGARFVVTHLGSRREKGRAWGQKRVTEALQRVLEQNGSVSLLVENSAGAGGAVGTFWDEIGEIIAGVSPNGRLGFCFDSCHGFAAGYDFRSEDQAEGLVKEIDRNIGCRRLQLLHLNDCRGFLGRHLDRHQHIGKGRIGIRGFRNLLHQPSLRRIPMILETPKKSPKDDPKNLSRIREIFQSLDAGPRGRTSGAQGAAAG